jgi:hypothetical protein
MVQGLQGHQTFKDFQDPRKVRLAEKAADISHLIAGKKQLEFNPSFAIPQAPFKHDSDGTLQEQLASIQSRFETLFSGGEANMSLLHPEKNLDAVEIFNSAGKFILNAFNNTGSAFAKERNSIENSSKNNTSFFKGQLDSLKSKLCQQVTDPNNKDMVSQVDKAIAELDDKYYKASNIEQSKSYRKVRELQSVYDNQEMDNHKKYDLASNQAKRAGNLFKLSKNATSDSEKKISIEAKHSNKNVDILDLKEKTPSQ